MIQKYNKKEFIDFQADDSHYCGIQCWVWRHDRTSLRWNRTSE